MQMSFRATTGLGPRASGLGRFVAPAAGLVLGGVFLWAVLQKSVDPRDTLAVGRYLFSEQSVLARPFLYGLLFFEIALGSLLIAGIARRAVFAATLATLLGFCGWLAYLKITNAPVSCGCGSNPRFLRDEALAGLARNAVLIAVCVAGWRFSPRGTRDGALSGSADPSEGRPHRADGPAEIV